MCIPAWLVSNELNEVMPPGDLGSPKTNGTQSFFDMILSHLWKHIFWACMQQKESGGLYFPFSFFFWGAAFRWFAAGNAHNGAHWVSHGRSSRCHTSVASERGIFSTFTFPWSVLFGMQLLRGRGAERLLAWALRADGSEGAHQGTFLVYGARRITLHRPRTASGPRPDFSLGLGGCDV